MIAATTQCNCHIILVLLSQLHRVDAAVAKTQCSCHYDSFKSVVMIGATKMAAVTLY
jgi:hypothetical protein